MVSDDVLAGVSRRFIDELFLLTDTRITSFSDQRTPACIDDPTVQCVQIDTSDHERCGEGLVELARALNITASAGQGKACHALGLPLTRVARCEDPKIVVHVHGSPDSEFTVQFVYV